MRLLSAIGALLCLLVLGCGDSEDEASDASGPSTAAGVTGVSAATGATGQAATGEATLSADVLKTLSAVEEAATEGPEVDGAGGVPDPALVQYCEELYGHQAAGAFDGLEGTEAARAEEYLRYCNDQLGGTTARGEVEGEGGEPDPLLVRYCEELYGQQAAGAFTGLNDAEAARVADYLEYCQEQLGD